MSRCPFKPSLTSQIYKMRFSTKSKFFASVEPMTISCRLNRFIPQRWNGHMIFHFTLANLFSHSVSVQPSSLKKDSAASPANPRELNQQKSAPFASRNPHPLFHPRFFHQNSGWVADAELEQRGVGVDFKIGAQRRHVEQPAFVREFLQGQRVQRHGVAAEPELF